MKQFDFCSLTSVTKMEKSGAGGEVSDPNG